MLLVSLPLCVCVCVFDFVMESIFIFWCVMHFAIFGFCCAVQGLRTFTHPIRFCVWRHLYRVHFVAGLLLKVVRM